MKRLEGKIAGVTDAARASHFWCSQLGVQVRPPVKDQAILLSPGLNDGLAIVQPDHLHFRMHLLLRRLGRVISGRVNHFTGRGYHSTHSEAMHVCA